MLMLPPVLGISVALLNIISTLCSKPHMVKQFLSGTLELILSRTSLVAEAKKKKTQKKNIIGVYCWLLQISLEMAHFTSHILIGQRKSHDHFLMWKGSIIYPSPMRGSKYFKAVLESTTLVTFLLYYSGTESAYLINYLINKPVFWVLWPKLHIFYFYQNCFWIDGITSSEEKKACRGKQMFPF